MTNQPMPAKPDSSAPAHVKSNPGHEAPKVADHKPAPTPTPEKKT